MRTGVTVQLSPTDRNRLQAIVDDRNSPQKHVWRARIVLGTAESLGTVEITRTAGVSKIAVWRWQERFMAEQVVALTLGEPPGATMLWIGQLMAKAAGISLTSVQRIWRAHGLAPDRVAPSSSPGTPSSPRRCTTS